MLSVILTHGQESSAGTGVSFVHDGSPAMHYGGLCLHLTAFGSGMCLQNIDAGRKVL
jgi:hypothetical protein